MENQKMHSPQPIIAKKLKEGDHLRVIAPAESFTPKFTEELKIKTVEGLEFLGLRVSFGKYAHDMNSFMQSII
ncbi:hypothetical protein [Salinimicrobium terrae]|uniref:hypothetical protein n=1 Tax=Salinimicrobium terrae TaxID=470866 RepID=UPI00041BBCCD|nr:hypothetical protein [Salinimicrobium terrae]